MKRKHFLLIVILIMAITLISGCASPNPMTGTPGETGKIAGFWNGLWDGFTATLAFIVNLFGGNYGVYEVHNNGAWYNFGFLLGIGAFSTCGGSSCRRR